MDYRRGVGQKSGERPATRRSAYAKLDVFDSARRFETSVEVPGPFEEPEPAAGRNRLELILEDPDGAPSLALFRLNSAVRCRG